MAGGRGKYGSETDPSCVTPSGGASSGSCTWKTVPWPTEDDQCRVPPAIRHQPRGAGKTQAQAAACLAAAIEGVEQVSAFRRADAPAAVADPPPQLFALPARANLDSPPEGWPEWRCAAGSRPGGRAHRDRPRPGLAVLELAAQADAPRLAFLLEAGQAGTQDVGGAAGSGSEL